MKARYVRISTGNQNVARQLAKSYPDEKIYIDIKDSHYLIETFIPVFITNKEPTHSWY